MAGNPTPNSKNGAVKTREERLKDALKANLAKRKAQSRSRARGAGARGEPAGKSGQDEGA